MPGYDNGLCSISNYVADDMVCVRYIIAVVYSPNLQIDGFAIVIPYIHK